MARRSTQELAFSAIAIEGGLLAPDFLNKVARLEATEQSEADYDVPRGLKLRDEIGRYWKIAQNLWQDFAARRLRSDLDTHAVTVRDFLEPFCRQVLGFTDLRPVEQFVLDERVFPIGFSAGEGRVPIVFAAHDQALDKPDSRHGDGVRRRSPFLLAQEYLNASERSLWAVVSNGLKLRILRDNPSLTRPAYIEADLEAIFTEGLYPDFAALWLLAHGTRFFKAGTEPADCPLERWRNTAQQDGIRARDRLRGGVTEALRSLGTGFISHPANGILRERIQSGELSTQSYFEQLLRLIYRLIFLATIEDRELVFTPDASVDARARYLSGYSLQRLRRLAARRRSYDRHVDLWLALSITFTGLSRGQPALGLPALGGLFDASQCSDLDVAQLDNQALLSALFSLCFFRDGAALSRVNYRDMDSEELGSVYESLLELVPNISIASTPQKFGFEGDDDEASTRGNARKLSGSYYTPDCLVQALINSALEPVIKETLAANPEAPVKALLGLSVCDPACGSGHFLLAAARRLAEEVALLSSHDSNPLPEDYRHALRDVVAHCIYGVDKNPMAIELARTALWLEAYTPDRPLTFLDHHLRCGDALLGVADPSVLQNGIPEKAFTAIDGDNNDVVKTLKRENREAVKAIERRRHGQRHMLGLDLQVAPETPEYEFLPDDSLEELELKRTAFKEAEARAVQSREGLAGDLLVAAFLLPKTSETRGIVPTTQDLYLCASEGMLRPGVAQAASAIARKTKVFHWRREFPSVFSRGGFDVVMGNPPWEVVQSRDADLDEVALAREKLWFGCGIYATLSGRRDLYKLFLALSPALLSKHGRGGFILPIGFMFEDDCVELRKYLFNRHSVVSILHGQNAKKSFFPDVHASYRFLAITLSKALDLGHKFSVVAKSPTDMVVPNWRDVSRAEFDSVIGENRNALLFDSRVQAETHKKIIENLFKFQLLRYRLVAEFHASSDKDLLLSSRESKVSWALLKNGSFHQYSPAFGPTERFVSREQVSIRLVRKELTSEWLARPRLVFRDIARNDDSRTLIACLVPPGFVSTYDAPMVVPDEQAQQSDLCLAFYAGYLNSFVADFIIRPFVDKHIKGYVLERIPIIEYDDDNPLMQKAAHLSLTLARESWEAARCGEESKSSNRLSNERLTLDVIFFKLAGSSKDDILSVLDSFDAIRREDINRHGDFRSLEMMMSAWDAFEQ